MFILELFRNEILISALLGWFFAQFTKMILYSIQHRKLMLRRMRGDGGMPSCHASTVVSLALAAGITYGFDSAAFALAAILAIIVMHDAMGVRAEAGKHAKVLNMFIQRTVMQEALEQQEHEDANGREDPVRRKMKEFIGHTPLEVFVGGVLGFGVSLLVNLVIWPQLPMWFQL